MVQPTFLYELMWNLLIVAMLVLVDRQFRIGHGRLFALYVAGYCLGRFGIELLRDDHATHIAGIRINTFTAAIVFLLAVGYFMLARRGREGLDELSPAADRAGDVTAEFGGGENQPDASDDPRGPREHGRVRTRIVRHRPQDGA